MAINFVTGLPRAGKTLWTITTVKERADREKRQVYTCNLTGVASAPGQPLEGWKEIDHPDKWMEVPDGCIIIVDELQDFWQKGATGSKVPPPILELSKHGKRGIDFYIITQEPNLVHQTPRDLCQHHYYVVRAFGTHNAMVHKYERMQLHPEKQKKNSEKLPFRYPKEAFTWYKSADTHNVKREIPWKVYAVPVAIVVAIAAIWGAIQLGQGAIERAKANGKKGKTDTGHIIPGLPGQVQPGQGGQQAPRDIVAEYTPRIPGLPHTAPRYDNITQATQAPYPAACVHMGEKCKCYTQQGTLLDTPKEMCVQIVKNGYFVDFQQQGQGQAQPPRGDDKLKGGNPGAGLS